MATHLGRSISLCQVRQDLLCHEQRRDNLASTSPSADISDGLDGRRGLLRRRAIEALLRSGLSAQNGHGKVVQAARSKAHTEARRSDTKAGSAGELELQLGSRRTRGHRGAGTLPSWALDSISIPGDGSRVPTSWDLGSRNGDVCRPPSRLLCVFLTYALEPGLV